jgi:hypothetical protein
MKTRFNFAAFDPRGRTMTMAEGETIPLGWFISVGGSAPVEVTENTTVVGASADISNPYDGGPEIWVRSLSVRTASETAAITAAAAADIIGRSEAARLTSLIEAAGIVGLSVKWDTYYATDKVGLRMGRDLVTEASVRGHLAYWLERQQAREGKAAAAAAAEAAKVEAAKVAAVAPIVRAEFLRCGWVAALGCGASPVPVDGEMYVYRKESSSEGYSLKDQDRSYFVSTGYRWTETVLATHPRYDAAIAAALAAEGGDVLAVIRLAMGDIVTPIAPPPPTVEENLAAEAAELAANKAANAARRQARYDADAAELAAIQAARLAKRYTGPMRLPHSQPESPAPAESPEAAPAPISSVNLNDPWGSLSALKL